MALGTQAGPGTPATTSVPADAEGRGRFRPEDLFLTVALVGLVAGACSRLAGAAAAGRGIWAATTVVGLIPAAWWVIEAIRAHRLGVDVIALLALAGTLVVGETLAGAVIKDVSEAV